MRFAGVGVLATLAHIAVAFAVFQAFDVTEQMANLAGFAAAVGLSYTGNSRWTFEASGPDAIYLPRFALLSLLGLAVSAGVTAMMTGLGFSYPFALLAVGLSVPPMTFIGSKFMVFNRHEAEAGNLAVPLGLLAASGVWMAFSGALLNHDTSWYLVAARKWLDGAMLYVDIVEVNPPLGFYLALPAIGLAELLGLSDTNGQVAFIALLTGLCVGWSAHLFLTSTRWSRSDAVLVSLLAMAAVTLPFTAHFAQREQILVLTLLPWISALLTAEDPFNGKGARNRAALAAVGLCLKPFFLAYPAATTLWQMGRERSLRPLFSTSNLTIGTLGAAYVLAVFWRHPDYFSEIVPNAQATYGAYGYGMEKVIQHAHLPLVFLSLLAGFLAYRHGVRVGALLAVLAAAILSYGVQWTGFSYQGGPILFAAVLTIGVAAIRTKQMALQGVAAAASCLTFLQVQDTGRYINTFADRQAAWILSEYGPGARLAVWSTILNPGFPLALEASAKWVPSAPALWYLPGAIPARAEADCDADPGLCLRLDALIEDTRNEMRRHVTTGCSDVLIIDTAMPYLAERGFDLSAFLAEDPALVRALDAYRPVETGGRMEVWQRGPVGTICRP